MTKKKITKKKNIESRKDHWNSTWNSEKRQDLIEAIRHDVTQKDACAYVWIAVSTLHDWLNRDKELMEEYTRAEKRMDIKTSNVIANWITNNNLDEKERMRYALEWKKRRDKRYRDKQETEHSWEIKNWVKDLSTEELLKIYNDLSDK